MDLVSGMFHATKFKYISLFLGHRLCLCFNFFKKLYIYIFSGGAKSRNKDLKFEKVNI